MKEEKSSSNREVDSILAEKVEEAGFWREIWQQLRLVYYLLRDPEVPFYLKLLPFAGIVYLLFPFDLLTDFAPVLGQVDDITALLISSKVFIELAPPAVVARHMQAIREQDGFVSSAGAESGESVDEVADAIVIEGEHEVVSKEDGKGNGAKKT
jgi:uncharacterized membrane protein YkvA (DUF1232 family)